jgi:hypothetical protein
MTRKNIKRFIGDPVFRDQFGNREALYYPLTQSGEPPENPVRENMYAAVLIDGQLTRWGAEAKEEAAKITAREER